jgi:hypothetical protein
MTRTCILMLTQIWLRPRQGSWRWSDQDQDADSDADVDTDIYCDFNPDPDTDLNVPMSMSSRFLITFYVASTWWVYYEYIMKIWSGCDCEVNSNCSPNMQVVFVRSQLENKFNIWLRYTHWSHYNKIMLWFKKLFPLCSLNICRGNCSTNHGHIIAWIMVG